MQERENAIFTVDCMWSQMGFSSAIARVKTSSCRVADKISICSCRTKAQIPILVSIITMIASATTNWTQTIHC